MNIWLDDVLAPRRDPEWMLDRITDWVWVKTIEELEALLVEREDAVEVMSFDYHLEGGKTGLDVIQWLAENHPDRYPQEVKVHSDDFIGALKIRQFDSTFRKAQEPATT